MIKRILSAEITQAICALSSGGKGEITLRTVKIKLKSMPKISAERLHANKESKVQGKSTGLAKGYKAMSRDTAREQEAHDWGEAVVGDS